MQAEDAFRRQARATWSAGDWDSFSSKITPVGELVLSRIRLTPGLSVLDVGTGSGGNVAIPAALAGTAVVGLDVTPELFEHARRRARDAGVDVEWVEGDAQELPFPEASFDRVISTFGAMFAPDHQRAAAELVRVCRPGGRVAMTTWMRHGFIGELFALTREFMPPPPGVETPPLWGVEDHVRAVFAAAGVEPTIDPEVVDFHFASVDDAVRQYATNFGPFVAARSVLEPAGRWDAFLDAFRVLVERFNLADGDAATIRSDYFLIVVER